MPYNKQLDLKQERNYQVLHRLTEIVRKKKNPKSLLGNLEDILPSPVTEHYRNKDHFHLRYDTDGKVVCGLFTGKPTAAGELVCVNPGQLINTRKEHSEIAALFENYINKSEWKICEHFQKGGHWREVIVRSNCRRELMVVVIVHPQNLQHEEIHEEMLKLKDYLANWKVGNIKSLYFQSWYEHLSI